MSKVNTDRKYLEELVEATMRVAPIVYRTKGQILWGREEEGDFVQEAMMHIVRLHNEGYIVPLDETKGTIDNLVSSLISGTFLLNRRNNLWRESKRRAIVYLNYESEGCGLPVNSVPTTDLNPHENYEKLITREALEHLIEKLDRNPVRTRKYTYKGVAKPLGEFELTEYNIATLMLLGYSRRQIIEAFGLDNTIEKRNQANFVRRMIKHTTGKLRKLAEEQRETFENYLV